MLAALGERGRIFDPLLHNTASPTIVAGGEKINVIPGEVALELDCRLLPGSTPEQVFAELRRSPGSSRARGDPHDPVAAEPDMGMFEMLAGDAARARPRGAAGPDAATGRHRRRFFSRLGIQTYGFLPMQMPAGMRFMQLIHAADERLPVDAVEFGTRAIELVLERF